MGWIFRPYRGVGVQVSAHVLNLEFQLVLSALVGALQDVVRVLPRRLGMIGTDLKGKVLKEVSGTVGLVSL
jgi:hypothetical protein